MKGRKARPEGILRNCPESPSMRSRILPLLLLSIFLPSWTYRQHYNPLDFTTGSFHDCPPQGNGGDPDHNVLKNRDKPPPSYEDRTVQAIIDHNPPLLRAQGKKARRNWTQPGLDLVTEWESKGARVEGYVIVVKPQGDESCNCGSVTDTDFHIALGRRQTNKEKECIVVEISPRLIPVNPNWNEEKLSRLESRKAKIRVSGWLLWDANHPNHLGKFRASLWEVHPIHVFEWLDGDVWRHL